MNLSERDRATAQARRDRKRKLAGEFAALTAVEKLAYIPGPDTAPSEFEIQSYIYQRLMELGYAVRGEVGTKCGTCTFDLVVYQDGRPLKILEVKKSRRVACFGESGKRLDQARRRKQVNRYSKFGVPVELIASLHQAADYIIRVREQGMP